MDNKALETEYMYILSDVLLDIGVSPKTKGYVYLKDAIACYIKNGDYYIKDIYNYVGAKNNIAPQNAERCIRYAIESAFNKCRLESQENIFGNSVNPLKGKPTNMELVCRIGDLIRLKLKNRII